MTGSRMNNIRFVLLALLLLAIPPSTWACIQTIWTFDDLKNDADVIVIAQPTETTNSGIVAPIKELSYVDPGGKKVIRVGTAVTTHFKVLTVLKGTADKEFTLTLYKLPPTKMSNGLVVPDICPYPYREFDPTAQVRYLIFLEKTAKGGLDLLEGQGNSFFSVIKLDGGPRP